MKRVLLICALCLLIGPAAFGQGLDDNRLGINYLVRGLVNEPSTTYLPDTTLNRLIHFANRTTLLALGENTNVDTATILCVDQQHVYSLNSNAITGSVVSVRYTQAAAEGDGDIGLVEVDPELAGKLGEGVPPNSYFVDGGYIFLGTSPSTNDTLRVTYVPRPQDLLADDSTLYVADEDVMAVAYLTAAYVYFRDMQVNLGTTYYQLWQQAVALKQRPVQVQGQ